MARMRTQSRLVVEAFGIALLFAAGTYTLLNIGDFAPSGLTGIAARNASDASTGSADGFQDSVARSYTKSAGSAGRSVELQAQRNGHYFAEAEINGRQVDVMVDTGATMVALTYEDALRAGFSPRRSDFTHRVSTANGIARVAPVLIDRIQIGDILVRDVRAAVLEEGKLGTTLLGMSFLSKLSSVSMRQGRLVLEE